MSGERDGNEPLEWKDRGELLKQLSQAVTNEGTLDVTRVTDREQLHIGSNGKAVERFAIMTAHGPRSFIFKPLTNVETIGREAWHHRHVVSRLADVRTPELLCTADHLDPDRYWSIFEDCGSLQHRLTPDHVAKAAALIPYWHSLPVQSMRSEFHGNKPGCRTAAEELIKEWDRVSRNLLQLGLTDSGIQELAAAIQSVESEKDERLVVSHGDFHRGNIGVTEEEQSKLVVLDWEHAHLNSPYWDLYHLLDITHPRIRRTINHSTRIAALLAYLTSADKLGYGSTRSKDDSALAFILGYYRFCAVYSAWMLILIQKDMDVGSWRMEDLLEAQKETFGSLEDSLRYMNGSDTELGTE